MNKIKEIIIPTELSEITLGKYQLLTQSNESDINDIDKSIKMISILCDTNIEFIRSIKPEQFNEISEILIKTLNKKSMFVDRFTIDGIEYGFIPNLDDISFGEYIDLDGYLKNPNDMNKVMTILYRPIINKTFGRYLIADYTAKEDTDIMLKAPMNAVNGAMVFFYRLGNELLKATQKYLELEVVKVQKDSQSNQILEQDGDGTLVSMQSLKEILPSLTKQLEQTYTKL